MAPNEFCNAANVRYRVTEIRQYIRVINKEYSGCMRAYKATIKRLNPDDINFYEDHLRELLMEREKYEAELKSITNREVGSCRDIVKSYSGISDIITIIEKRGYIGCSSK